MAYAIKKQTRYSSSSPRATASTRPETSRQSIPKKPSVASNLLQRLSPWLLLISAGTVSYLCVTGNHGLLYLNSLNKQLEQISDKNSTLVSEIFDLRYEIRGLEEKGLLLEKKAREELGLSRDGETIYLFEN